MNRFIVKPNKTVKEIININLAMDEWRIIDCNRCGGSGRFATPSGFSEGCVICSGYGKVNRF